MNRVRARAPLRLGLAGGGTDVSPYCDVYGGYVLNGTIDRYAYATITPLAEPEVRLISTDRQLGEARPLAHVGELGKTLDLHATVYRHMMTAYHDGKPMPLELSTFCDAPAGSGLGASSTLVVAMVKSFAELLNLPLGDYDIARVAFEIERVECGLHGGRQDQYAATFGGFNFMEFYADNRAIINPLRIKESILCELEASLVLFYTGMSRESATIIADQRSNVMAGQVDAIEAMHAMKQEALQMKECLLKGDFEGIIDSMHAGWEGKKKSARTVSNSLIEDIYRESLAAGARAGKISGAGGGGYMMLFVPAERRLDVIRALGRFEGQASNCHFTTHGTQAWRT
jgi:D-glycero-alpha-D-manno-heptose-7-phosphate kinase